MERRKPITILTFALFMLILTELPAQPRDQLSQISTIDALLAGAFDGIVATDELVDFGNFGLGTFDKLDGEMIIYNGYVYQVKFDGTVTKNDIPKTTPFAAVVNFNPEEVFDINEVMNLDGLIEKLSDGIENSNLPVAVKVSGTFDYVKVRSVKEQEKPYPALAEAAKDQSVFEYENITGVLIGFIIPDYFKSFNVPGLHVHFLADDENKGGHLLDLRLNDGTVEVDLLNRFYVYLPGESDHFNKLDLNKDRSKELEEVER